MNLLELFRTEKKFLQFGCYYPQSYTLRSSFIGFFMLFYSWLEFLSMVAVLFVERSNLTKLSETLLFCMTQAAFLCKLANFLYKNKRIVRIEQLLQLPILRDLQESEERVIEEYMLEVSYLARIFRVLCFFTVVFYGIFPFIDEDPEHMLPLPGWFPFDVSTYQLELVAGQVLGIAIGAFINSTLDILPTVLISLGSAQFDILRERLVSCISNQQISTGEVLKQIESCVLYHNTILLYIKEVENLFSDGIVVQFAASVVVICLTGFQMLVISVKSMQFVQLICYFSTMMCQIVLYCWYGNQLMYRSSRLIEACYISKWYNSNSQICKSLFIIMERGKKPVVLTAGKLFSLTLTTLMTILKSSYSYFAVLQRLYSKAD